MDDPVPEADEDIDLTHLTPPDTPGEEIEISETAIDATMAAAREQMEQIREQRLMGVEDHAARFRRQVEAQRSKKRRAF